MIAIDVMLDVNIILFVYGIRQWIGAIIVLTLLLLQQWVFTMYSI